MSAEIGVRELINILTLEGLTVPDVDGRPLPGLAENWTWERDGLRLRVRLRNGVTFHDGTALTPAFAADVIREFMGQGNPLYPSFNEVISVQPDSDQEIVFDLSAKSALLPEDLQFPLTKRNGSEQIGTGAYRIASRDEEGEVVLEAFDQYHLGTPHIGRLVLTPFDAIRTAWASLLRGDVDMVTDVPAEAVEFVRNDSVEVVSFARRYQFLLAFNSRRPLLASPGVRRALNLAVDREEMIKTVLQGHGVPAAGPIWPKHWAFDATTSSAGFDRTYATSLLDAAGLRPGAAGSRSEIPDARMHLMCLLPGGFSVLERIALNLQKQLYEIDVDMQFQVVPIEEYDRRIRTGDFESVLIDMISGPTLTRPYIFWSSPKRYQGINAFGYENAQAERLFEQLRTSTNEASIRSAVSRLQRVFLNDPPALFLAWNERTRAFRRDFKAVLDKDRDPLYTIWQWTENPDREPISTQ